MGFRYKVLEIANRYQLKGVIRKLPDNTIEMVIQGPGNSIDNCIRKVKKTCKANIRETIIEEITLNHQYEDLRIAF